MRAIAACVAAAAALPAYVAVSFVLAPLLFLLMAVLYVFGLSTTSETR